MLIGFIHFVKTFSAFFNLYGDCLILTFIRVGAVQSLIVGDYGLFLLNGAFWLCFRIICLQF